MYHAEAAPGQYEVVTAPLPPLQAVDALIHTREIIYNIASKHGLRATLAPRVFLNNSTFFVFFFRVRCFIILISMYCNFYKPVALHTLIFQSTLQIRSLIHQPIRTLPTWKLVSWRAYWITWRPSLCLSFQHLRLIYA